jgi:REP element-mobilizing transposase RayT
MARPLRIEYPGAFYHVTARGNEQRDIFRSRSDREKFLSYMESATGRYGAVVHCYCLMSNHYHLLLQTQQGNLSQIMRHINGAYTTYFNVKRKRVGHLLQGRYKAILVEADTYAAELSRYIHLNPVRAGIVARPEDYAWSSYRCFVGRQRRAHWLATDFILGSITAISEDAAIRYQRFVEDRMGGDYENPLKGAVAATILGTEKFVQAVVAKHVKHRQADRNVPAVKGIAGRWTIEQIVATTKAVIDEDENLGRKVCITLCHRFSGAKLKEIGARFGISDAAVAQTSCRLMKRAVDDEVVRKVLERVVNLLGGEVKVET